MVIDTVNKEYCTMEYWMTITSLCLMTPVEPGIRSRLHHPQFPHRTKVLIRCAEPGVVLSRPSTSIRGARTIYVSAF